MSRKVLIAKIAAPRLFGVAARTRLFDVLDCNRGRPLIWLDSPPGAGKSTLMASYLERRAIPTLWYQLDATDADPAVLFQNLDLGARSLRAGGRLALPQYAAEHGADIDGFCRLFFRALHASLPAGTVLVFDNYQEVADDAPLHGIVRGAVEQAPPGHSVACLSRAQPPAAFSALAASASMVTLRWDSLRLTTDETREIARGRGLEDEGFVQALHRESDGWAAGITLMLERVAQSVHDPAVLSGDSREVVFEYFAALLFDRLTPARQTTLAALSFLPYVTQDMAREVGDDPDSAALLESLHRRRMFVDRRPDAHPVYVFHALFRDFLRRRAGQMWDTEALNARRLRCTRVLEGVNDTAAVVELLLENDQWRDAATRILAYADRTLHAGRRETLERWIETLPAEVRQTNPMCLYWLGVARAQTDPRRGITTLEAALREFDHLGEIAGQITCLTALLKFGYVAHTAIELLNEWLDALLLRLDSSGDASLAPREALSVWGALCSTLLFVRPWHPWTGEAVRRVIDLVPACDDTHITLASAMTAMEQCYLTGRFAAGEDLAEIILPLAADGSASPSEAGWALIQLGYFRFYQARYEDAMAAFDAAVTLVRRNGQRTLLRRALLCRFMVEFRVFGWDKAHATLREAEDIRVAMTPADRGFQSIFQARRAQHHGQWDLAADMAEESYAAILRMRTPHLLCVWSGFCAEVLAQAGRGARARQMLEEGNRIVERSEIHDWWRAYLALADAYISLCEQDMGVVLVKLRDGIDLAKTGNRKYGLRFLETAMPPLFAMALREGIEVDFVRHLIRMFRLRPPEDAPDQWPWPIRLFTLGRFDVVIEDRTLEFPRKTPRKTLALLKALVAYGGAEVPEQWLCDALWGDEEADAAREALGITVLRLRKLLGRPEAIVQKGGRLSLDRSLVWTDAWSFDRQAAGSTPEAACDALELYAGAFLPADEGDAWSVSARERLRGRFIHLLATQGATLEVAGEVAKAMNWYLRGIDADPIVEAFHQGLMRCYQQLGRHTEAISAFRRLRQTLSVVLGVAPSKVSHELCQGSVRACARENQSSEPVGPD